LLPQSWGPRQLLQGSGMHRVHTGTPEERPHSTCCTGVRSSREAHLLNLASWPAFCRRADVTLSR
jgi:hypothetical protein